MHSISTSTRSISILPPPLEAGQDARHAAILSVFEPLDEFVLDIDPEFIQIDQLLFCNLSGADFRKLFPGAAVDLIFSLKKEKRVQGKIDHESLCLSVNELSKLFAGFSQLSSITLKVTATEPRAYEVILPAALVVDDAKSLLQACDSLLQDGWERPFNALSSGFRTNESVFQFHEEACSLQLCQPLDKLISLATLPDFFPYPHQIQAVKAVISKFRGRALLCDEVGLGKTIEASLVLLEYLRRGLANRILILTPPALAAQWQEELRRKFSLDFVINDEERFAGFAAHDKIIASIAKAKLSPHKEELTKQEFDLVIVDEAHHLRNKNTKAWQLVNELKKRYLLLLTATPMQNGLSDIYNLVTVLKPGHLKTYQEFRRRFVNTKDEFEPRNLNQLRGLLQDVMVRNKRSHTNIILSRRFARTIELDLHPAELEFYAGITTIVRRGMIKEAAQVKPLVDAFTLQLLQLEAGSSVPAALKTLSKLVGRVLPETYKKEIESALALGNDIAARYGDICRKADAVAEILLRHGEKTVIFTRFHETQLFLIDYLEGRNFTVSAFHGGLTRLEKEEQIRLFAGGNQVLVSSEAGGEGRNMQFCRNLINYDLPWNPMKIEQRIGRIHRLGQEQDVQIYNLSASGTAESHVLALLDKKINLFELVVGEVDMILGNLEDEKDFEETLFAIWYQSENDGQVAQRFEDLGKRLADAKAQYLRSQEFDDKVFGDALLTA